MIEQSHTLLIQLMQQSEDSTGCASVSFRSFLLGKTIHFEVNVYQVGAAILAGSTSIWYLKRTTSLNEFGGGLLVTKSEKTQV